MKYQIVAIQIPANKENVFLEDLKANNANIAAKSEEVFCVRPVEMCYAVQKRQEDILLISSYSRIQELRWISEVGEPGKSQAG